MADLDPHSLQGNLHVHVGSDRMEVLMIDHIFVTHSMQYTPGYNEFIQLS